MAHELRIYERNDGFCQVKDYLRAQSKAVRGKAGWLLTRLEKEGGSLERPIADYLDGGIYELRIVVQRHQHRILYFFARNVIVATNAFLKKSAAIPKAEIVKAKQVRADWLSRETKR